MEAIGKIKRKVLTDVKNYGIVSYVEKITGKEGNENGSKRKKEYR